MNLHKNIALILFFLFSLIGKSQSSLYFDKYYYVGFNNTLTSNVIQLEDTSYVLLNYVKDSITGQQNMSLIRIDRFGNIIKQKTHNFGSDYLAYLYGLNQLSNLTKNSIAISATTFTNSNTTVILSKVNKNNLDTIKNTIYYDGLFNYYLSSITKINSNKFYLIGNKFNSTNYWPVFFEVDSNLTIKNITTSINTQSVSVRSGFYLPGSNSIILSGSKPSGFNSYSFISIADTLGNISNTYINNTCDNGVTQAVYSSFDNTYITIGSKKTSVFGGQNMYRLYVCKYDANLNLLWQKTYCRANMVNNLFDAVVNPDGTILTVGRYSDSLANPLVNINCNAIMLKIRPNGDSLWMKQFDNLNNPNSTGPKWYEGFEGIDATPEGGYIMCGNVMQMPQAKAWVVKTDSLGCDTSTCLLSSGVNVINTVVSSITIYPNPNNGIFTIDLSNTNFDLQDVSIEICNVLGQCIKKQAITHNKQNLNLNDSANGLYYLQLKRNGTVLEVLKVVKE